MSEMQALFTQSARLKIALIAGEASGDILGASLISVLKSRLPHAEFSGIGGARMLAQGFKSICPMDLLSVNGYVEVLRRLPGLLALRSRLKRQLLRERPDIVIGIDAPDFNLDVERACKEAGIATVHYASPSIWAWRKERIHTIKRSVDHVLCLFPMEPDLYREVDLPASFVGHPLADQIDIEIDRDAARKTLAIPLHVPLLAMLPGSRQSEIKRLGPTLIQTAELLRQARPDIRFVVPLATPETRAEFQSLLARSSIGTAVMLVDGQSHTAMAAADVVLVKSGTSTLEAALLKRPMVITYKVSSLTAWLMKRKAYLPWVGLPNILLKESVVPEILQDQATPENLAEAVLRWLNDEQACLDLQGKFTALHRLLKRNAAESAAAIVVDLVKKSGAMT